MKKSIIKALITLLTILAIYLFAISFDWFTDRNEHHQGRKEARIKYLTLEPAYK